MESRTQTYSYQLCYNSSHADANDFILWLTVYWDFLYGSVELMMATYKVVLIRHGESEWNKVNNFSGWYDADLSELGVEEAKKARKVVRYLDMNHLTACADLWGEKFVAGDER